MYRFRFSFVILLFVSLCALPSSLVAQKSTSIKVRTKFIDSLSLIYYDGLAQPKLNAALQLWSIYNQNSKHLRVVDYKSLSGIDSAELNHYIQAELRKLENEKLAIDFRLMRIVQSKAYAQIVNEVEVSNYTNKQLAVYYYIRGLNAYFLDVKNPVFVDYFQKSLHFAYKEKGMWVLQYHALAELGAYHFRDNQIDSATKYFEKQLVVFDKIKPNSIGYLEGYRVHYQSSPSYGKVLNNLGMCYQKRGDLVKSISILQRSMAISDSLGSFWGYFWAKGLIVNAFLDLGDYERANVLFEQYVKELQERSNNKVKANNAHIVELLLEYDFYDLQACVPFIDSVLKTLDNADSKVSVREKVTGSVYGYAGTARFWSQQLLLKSIQNPDVNYLNEIDSFQMIYKYHQANDHVDTVRHLSTARAIEILSLAWKIALNAPNEDENFKRLMQILTNKVQAYHHARHLKMALAILHQGARYKEEIEILSFYLPILEKGGHLIDLTKYYYQAAEAYQGVGNLAKAYEYLQKFEKLRQKTQQTNHHQQLSAFDKRLELEKLRHSEQVIIQENEINKAKRFKWFIIAISTMLVLLLSVVLLINIKRRNLAESEKKALELESLSKSVEQKENALENTTMELIKSNTSFQHLLAEIEELTSSMKVESKKKARSILAEHKAQLQNKIWNDFNLQFQNSNAEFYRQLKSKNSTLTESEMRIAAMHLSGLSNKEISAITGQQLSSLHTLKSRLRKKLNVGNDDELFNLLNQIIQP